MTGSFLCWFSIVIALEWHYIIFSVCACVCTHCLPERACGVSRQDGHGLVFDVIYYARVRNLWARIPLSVFVCVSSRVRECMCGSSTAGRSRTTYIVRTIRTRRRMHVYCYYNSISVLSKHQRISAVGSICAQAREE